MYKIAEFLGAKIAAALKYDEEQKAVITYGLLAIIQFIIVMVLIISISSFFGTVVASLILSFSVSILRVNAGGAHLSSITVCSIIGVIISVFMPTVFNLLGVQYITAPILYVICNIILVLVLWVIAVKAPVDTPNKPIVSDAKKKRLRRKSINVVLFYFLVGNYLYISDGMCTFSVYYSVYHGKHLPCYV
jgi:accessory gene regulator B